MTDIFWMRRRPNFGDALAPVLARRFGGIDPRWSPPWRSDAVVIGSIATRLPRGYRGVVLGVGFLYEQDRVDLRAATVLGLRGELTRLRAGLDDRNIVLGDPGLLAVDLFGQRPPVSHQLGVVPHFRDDALAVRHPQALVVDVGQEPEEVVRAIASCERIISSSLHGLIVADSFGIERRWEPHAAVRGGGFKFADYVTALGTTIEPDVWATAPSAAVDSARAALRDAFAALAPAIADTRRHRRPGALRALERFTR